MDKILEWKSKKSDLIHEFSLAIEQINIFFLNKYEIQKEDKKYDESGVENITFHDSFEYADHSLLISIDIHPEDYPKKIHYYIGFGRVGSEIYYNSKYFSKMDDLTPFSDWIDEEIKNLQRKMLESHNNEYISLFKSNSVFLLDTKGIEDCIENFLSYLIKGWVKKYEIMETVFFCWKNKKNIIGFGFEIFLVSVLSSSTRWWIFNLYNRKLTKIIPKIQTLILKNPIKIKIRYHIIKYSNPILFFEYIPIFSHYLRRNAINIDNTLIWLFSAAIDIFNKVRSNLDSILQDHEKNSDNIKDFTYLFKNLEILLSKSTDNSSIKELILFNQILIENLYSIYKLKKDEFPEKLSKISNEKFDWDQYEISKLALIHNLVIYSQKLSNNKINPVLGRNNLDILANSNILYQLGIILSLSEKLKHRKDSFLIQNKFLNWMKYINEFTGRVRVIESLFPIFNKEKIRILGHYGITQPSVHDLEVLLDGLKDEDKPIDIIQFRKKTTNRNLETYYDTTGFAIKLCNKHKSAWFWGVYPRFCSTLSGTGSHGYRIIKSKLDQIKDKKITFSDDNSTDRHITDDLIHRYSFYIHQEDMLYPPENNLIDLTKHIYDSMYDFLNKIKTMAKNTPYHNIFLNICKNIMNYLGFLKNITIDKSNKETISFSGLFAEIRNICDKLILLFLPETLSRKKSLTKIIQFLQSTTYQDQLDEDGRENVRIICKVIDLIGSIRFASNKIVHLDSLGQFESMVIIDFTLCLVLILKYVNDHLDTLSNKVE